ncbi:hypothetical protein [uncultured Ramlibacter sp.]|uniref:hypothetical protein n=1 Tax=uncultured Ramlibacter sp. TaxID=260755 RepID=UPI00261C62C9|nr:hypothetical protein [uncultured Ramlibacter sp.]
MSAWLFAIPGLGPVLAAAWACLQVLIRVCNAIPGAVWAVLALVLAWWAWDAAGDRDSAQRSLAQLQQAVLAQKAEAAKKLATETANVLRLERELGAAKIQLEAQDAKNAETIDGLRADLLRKSRAGGGGGLRDPHAAGCRGGGGGAQAQDPGTAGRGGEDGAQASGLLSAPLERLLLELTGAADDINRAYIACRVDSLSLRATLATTPP